MNFLANISFIREFCPEASWVSPVCVCVCFVPVTLDFSGNKLGYHFLWYEEVVEGCSLAQKGRWRLPFLWFWFLWNRICSKGRVHQDRGPWERTQFYFANSPSGLKAKTWDRRDMGTKLHFALILIRIGKHSWKRDFSLLCLIQSPLLSLGISSFNFFFFFSPVFNLKQKSSKTKQIRACPPAPGVRILLFRSFLSCDY